MPGSRAVSTFISVLGSALLAGCAGPPDDPSVPEPPRYRALSVPRGDLSLPALLVGDEEVVSSACFRKTLPARKLPAPAALKRRVTGDCGISASLRALFRKYLVKAGLEAETARRAVEKFRFEASGLVLREMDPARVRPDFGNIACTQRELGYFREAGRKLVVGALGAEQVRVELSERTERRVGVSLDTALERMGAELGVGFDRRRTREDTTELSGGGLVFGVRRTTLFTRRCQVSDLSLAAGTTRDLCGGLFKLRVEPLTPRRYRLLVTPRTGTTDESLQRFGRQGVRAVSDLHAVWLYLDPGRPMTGSFVGILVGARGDGG